MNHPPTDPIRLLLEAAEKAISDNPLQGEPDILKRKLFIALPALTALVAEREKARALITEFREEAWGGPDAAQFPEDGAKLQCADRLAAIVEGK